MEALTKRLNPLNDYLFFKVMGEKGDEVQLLAFLNAVLSPTLGKRFVSVEILENKTFVPDIMGGKMSILDLRAVLEDGTRVNVEVQLKNQGDMDRRTLFYWSREYGSQLEAGQGYQELPNVVGINIVNFEMLATKKWHSVFHMREDTEREVVLTEALEIHFIEMPKYKAMGKKDTGDELMRWLMWLDKDSPQELVEEIVKMDKGIELAERRVKHVSQDEEGMRAYFRREMAMSDMATMEYHARRQGREEEKIKIAVKALAEGAPVELVSKITGLDVESIKAVKTRACPQDSGK
jgi:predicted transposase/invertase (TIGR01784 family)